MLVSLRARSRAAELRALQAKAETQHPIAATTGQGEACTAGQTGSCRR
jgi:hypothetical protein